MIVIPPSVNNLKVERDALERLPSPHDIWMYIRSNAPATATALDLDSGTPSSSLEAEIIQGS